MRRQPNAPRVALVMEIGVYREALAEALARAGLSVVTDGDGPEVVLVDVTMPDGIETLRGINSRKPGLRLLALAVRELEPDVLACIEAGAVGYIPQDASLEELADAIRRAACDEPL